MLTQCLHFTADCTTAVVEPAVCTTGWVNYANEPTAKRRFSGPVIRLTRSKAAVWTVDDVARLIDFLNRILTYFTIGSMILRDDKN